jgi:hypothetical protein
MVATAVDKSGIGLSAISRWNPKPTAEGRTAGTRKADALVAVTCHPKIYHLHRLSSPIVHPESPHAYRYHLRLF